MTTDIKAIETLLSALGVSLPVELLDKLGIQDYLDQLDKVVALAAGERQRLGELLGAATRISAAQLDEALAIQRKDGRLLGEILIEKNLLSQRERDVLLEFQQRQAGSKPESGKLALGNIMVASGQITRSQLESALLRQAKSGRHLGDELISVGAASKGQVVNGLMLQKKLVSYALSATMGVAPLPALVSSADAAQASAVMQVSATVIANARLQTSHQTTQLVISAADIARGFVQVPGASRFSVITNSRIGYVIEVHPLASWFESVQVTGMGGATLMGAEGGSIIQRGVLPSKLAHELSFRFALRPDARPGSYPWPLLLSVRAL